MARRKRKRQRRITQASAVIGPADGSLERILSEKEFLPLLVSSAQPFFRLTNFLVSTSPTTWSESHMFSLLTEANVLESFLDDFDARNNGVFTYLTELVASLRGFANAAHALQHLQRRYPKYGVEDPAGVSFEPLLADAIEWTTVSISKLLKELYQESEARGIPIPREAVGDRHFPSAFARLRLPRTADEEDVADEQQRIAEVASKYLKTCDLIEGIGIEKISDPIRLRHFVAKSCSEEKARFYEAGVHNLQSKYDTYIKNTAFEAKDANLRPLRGYISVSLHLLEYVTHLVHFYERHENDIRSEKTKQRIARIIVKGEVLDNAINFGLCCAAGFLRRGRAHAQAIFPAYTRLRVETLQVPNGTTLHLRPATLIYKVAAHYGTPVQMRIGVSDWIDAGSPIRVAVAFGMNPEAREVVFRADEAVLRDYRALFDCGLGEGPGGLDQLPERLSYLR
ncbi:MAG: hypothetical protein JNJ88_18035 [Planctomycetes bacterium]|nr:hypothetical protein [Planctomycetota bacterium]